MSTTTRWDGFGLWDGSGLCIGMHTHTVPSAKPILAVYTGHTVPWIAFLFN